MKLRSTLGHSAFACALAFGITSCGDDESTPVTPPDAGGSSSTLSDTSEPVTDTSSSSAPNTTDETATSSAMTASTNPTSDVIDSSTSLDVSSESMGSDVSSASTSAPTDSTTSPIQSDTSSDTSGSGSTEVIVPCSVPPLSVFSRSDTDQSWDDNDFSSVTIDAAGCPPAVYVNATWPHEEGWANADPSEANLEQTHFTLDSYAASNLVNKEITATVELVDDVRGPNANAGGYLVSIVSVSTYDRVVVLDPVVVPDAGPDAGEPEPQTITETGYTEAESDPEDRVLLRHVGDRATITFRVPMKTEEVDSYDPTRVLKVNLRFYNVYEGVSPEVEAPLDAGVDAAFDASVGETEEGDPSLVYDYLTSRFAISRFTVTDVPGIVVP